MDKVLSFLLKNYFHTLFEQYWLLNVKNEVVNELFFNFLQIYYIIYTHIVTCTFTSHWEKKIIYKNISSKKKCYLLPLIKKGIGLDSFLRTKSPTAKFVNVIT